MKPEPTIKLFEEVINVRGVHNQLGMTANAVQKLRANHKLGKVTLDRMHQILKLAGYQVVQETKWSKAPKSVKIPYEAPEDFNPDKEFDRLTRGEHTLIQFEVKIDSDVKMCAAGHGVFGLQGKRYLMSPNSRTVIRFSADKTHKVEAVEFPIEE